MSESQPTLRDLALATGALKVYRFDATFHLDARSHEEAERVMDRLVDAVNETPGMRFSTGVLAEAEATNARERDFGQGGSLNEGRSSYEYCPDCGHPWREHHRGHLVCMADWPNCCCDGDQSGRAVLVAAAHGEIWAIEDAKDALDALDVYRAEVETRDSHAIG